MAGSPALAQAPEAGGLERYAEEGQKALAERRWADAARAYEKLRELSPETAEVHAQLGMIYFQQHDFARAVPTLRKALKLKPGLPNVDILLAMCLSEVGQYKEALPGLQKGIRPVFRRGAPAATGLQLQRTYTGLGQDDKAVEVALQLTRLYKDDPEILYHTGRLFSNYAYLMTMRLAEVAPASVWMHQAAGEANESLASYDAALDDYRKVLALAPDRPGIHYRLGRVFLARARPPSRRPTPRPTPPGSSRRSFGSTRATPTPPMSSARSDARRGTWTRPASSSSWRSSTIPSSRKASSAWAGCSSPRGRRTWACLLSPRRSR